MTALAAAARPAADMPAAGTATATGTTTIDAMRKMLRVLVRTTTTTRAPVMAALIIGVDDDDDGGGEDAGVAAAHGAAVTMMVAAVVAAAFRIARFVGRCSVDAHRVRASVAPAPRPGVCAMARSTMRCLRGAGGDTPLAYWGACVRAGRMVLLASFAVIETMQRV